jgi:hypothetical protein
MQPDQPLRHEPVGQLLASHLVVAEDVAGADVRPEAAEEQAFGNVLTAVAFLEWVAAGELRPDELGYRDDDSALIAAARARKAGDPA